MTRFGFDDIFNIWCCSYAVLETKFSNHEGRIGLARTCSLEFGQNADLSFAPISAHFPRYLY